MAGEVTVSFKKVLPGNQATLSKSKGFVFVDNRPPTNITKAHTIFL